MSRRGHTGPRMDNENRPAVDEAPPTRELTGSIDLALLMVAIAAVLILVVA